MSNTRLYTDDTYIFLNYDDPDAAAFNLEPKLEKIEWVNKWFATFNPEKTVNFPCSRKDLYIHVHASPITM